MENKPQSQKSFVSFGNFCLNCFHVRSSGFGAQVPGFIDQLSLATVGRVVGVLPIGEGVIMRDACLDTPLTASSTADGGATVALHPGPVEPAVIPRDEPRFATQIVSGDSLSDVDTYAVGPVKALGGGKFTIDGDHSAVNPALSGQNWVGQLARLVELQAPCAAQSGLDGDAALACNAFDPAVAALAIREAMARARAVPGSTEENVGRATIASATGLPGNAVGANPTLHVPMVAKAKSDAELAGNQCLRDAMQALVAAMGTAGAELAVSVKEQILSDGAEYVVVNNLPDAALTPAGRAMGPKIQALIAHICQTFNARLRNALAQDARVLLVDAYALTQAAAANPAAYGPTNIPDTACDLFSQKNPLRSSLGSSASSLKAGDVSRHACADGEHPTPFFYGVLANHVSERMRQHHWL
ncbi:hypothetical protein [Comamonas endophytica]|uniref:Phospholipase/lecithinase/hemolysin n=1 Tax=Comamonas endophytica TaxID=2949090 RepID=A0ABY6GFT6_9BURK|nr:MULTISPECIES: hypothetical protein [unclassified Acidovorax]MCD2513341.1 hypothetical protein [Acidovorax sp. D4N7]UYG53874.1 hypothetical protein M9799_18245 [Acidovorax sp. 5MLIR]